MPEGLCKNNDTVIDGPTNGLTVLGSGDNYKHKCISKGKSVLYIYLFVTYSRRLPAQEGWWKTSIEIIGWPDLTTSPQPRSSSSPGSSSTTWWTSSWYHRWHEEIYSQVILHTAESKKISCFPENVAKLAKNVSKFSWISFCWLSDLIHLSCCEGEERLRLSVQARLVQVGSQIFRLNLQGVLFNFFIRVCERKGADSTQDCQTLDSATLKPDSNWGWCLVRQS